MKKCPKCGAEYPDRMGFCVKDGTPLAAVEEQAEADPENEQEAVSKSDVPEQPARMVCPKCGAVYGTDMKFCRKDGTALQPAAGQPDRDKAKKAEPAGMTVMVCPSCGTVYPDTRTKFCKKDGTALELKTGYILDQKNVPPVQHAGRAAAPRPKRTENTGAARKKPAAPAGRTAGPSKKIVLPVIIGLAAAAAAGLAVYFLYPLIREKLRPAETVTASDAVTAEAEKTAGMTENPAEAPTEDTTEESTAADSAVTLEEAAETEDSAPAEEETADTEEEASEEITEEPEKPSIFKDIDPSEIDSIIGKKAGSADYAVALLDLSTGELTGTDGMDEPMSSSVILDIPLLYTMQKEIENGEYGLDTKVTFTYSVGGRGKHGQSDSGKKYPLEELAADMLRYSDNDATNSLLDYVGYDRINRICSSNGFDSVSIVNKIGKTTDYTSNDNYVSASDTAEMLRYLYNCDGPINRDFLDKYMYIEDSQGNKGLGKHAGKKLDFHNLNGVKPSKYNEAALIEDRESGENYVIVFLSNGKSLETLQGAAAEVGSYIIDEVREAAGE